MDRTDTQHNTLRYDAADLQQAVAVMQRGGIILYPTDTVWGIGCDAT
ncbi:MAG: Sua5/YciO/YrdC/YwlC family protein, partial [Muribaculaceae bacterium]|nr:Sua5/YciO/YrdC/YwlC family protein [Muribaculaceae bacterium]